MQAVKVALHGLEDFRNCTQTITEIQNHLMDRTLQMEIHDINVEEDNLIVTFYDINGKVTIDMNKILFAKILDNIVLASKIHVIMYCNI